MFKLKPVAVVLSMAVILNSIDSAAMIAYADAKDKPAFIAEYCREHFNTDGRVARQMTPMAFKSAVAETDEFARLPLGAYALGSPVGTAAFMV